MSHSHERKEKNCLNCGAEVAGRYCQVCGQENVVVKDSFFHLVIHFFNDITHFDGKFFNSARYLIARPGKLTYEYVNGRRVRYLHPIRMYVFTSAFFFLIYFSFINKVRQIERPNAKKLAELIEKKQQELGYFNDLAENRRDTVFAAAATRNIYNTEQEIRRLKDSLAITLARENVDKDKTEHGLLQGKDSSATKIIAPAGNSRVKEDLALVHKDPVAESVLKDVPGKDEIDRIDIYKTADVYIAMQRELPPARRDGMLKKGVNMKLLHWLGEDTRKNTGAYRELIEKFKHSFPTLLFVSLPIFAFLLKLLYIRRKEYYYSDHGIFAIHAYCALFLLLLLYYGLEAVANRLHGWFFSVALFLLAFYMYYYVYKAMRYFYEQSRLKTLLKFLLLNFMTSVVMFFLVALFFIITAVKA